MFTLIHIDGGEVTGTQQYLSKTLHISLKNINAVCIKEKKSTHGWFNKDVFEKPLTRKELCREGWRNKQTKIELYHIDGDVWFGYPTDAPVKVGRFINGEIKCVDGWFQNKDHIVGYKEHLRAYRAANSRKRGDITGLNNPRADATIYKWKNLITGEILESTRFDMWNSGKCTKSGLASVFKGRQTKTNNWEMIREET